MNSILYFDKMITPRIITLIYWLLALVAIISGLASMFGGWEGFTFGKFLFGVGIAVGGILGARIWCELLIVLFKIHENTTKIAERSP